VIPKILVNDAIAAHQSSKVVVFSAVCAGRRTLLAGRDVNYQRLLQADTDAAVPCIRTAHILCTSGTTGR
jgi:acyl-coenzyme A synthetase/AMP-(fatty) acid ligase